MIGFWFSIEVILAVGVADGLGHLLAGQQMRLPKKCQNKVRPVNVAKTEEPLRVKK